MNNAYSFVREADPLKKIDSHNQYICVLSQQTIECAYFIRDYAKNKSFWMRTAMHILSDVDSKIQQYMDKFLYLISGIQGLAVVRTEITVLRALDDVKEIAAEVDLNDMPYAEGARYDPEKECLPGTREQIIEEICDWINGDGDNRLYLLTGVAGCGKSAIAHTVAQRFDKLGRLGSSFCFDRSRQSARRPDNLFSTIARDLADLSPQHKRSLWYIVKDKRSLRTTSSIREQFEKFILAPAMSLASVGPVLIMIDALDESGDEACRATLLDVLAHNASALPPHFRILITARQEKDINDAFRVAKHVFCKSMDSLDRASTANDIRKFIVAQLAGVPVLDRRWPGLGWCQRLVDKSEGLFQWAFTACQFVKGKGKHGRDPCEQLQIILSSAPLSGSLGPLDQLYHDILAQLFDVGDDGLRNRFRSVMGTLLASMEPLSISTLRSLHQENEHSQDVELILRPMGSLLTGVSHESIPVHALHSSFRDFLTDPRSGPFFVAVTHHHRHLALACLRLMKANLRFNICDLETSHVPNRDIPGLPARVQTAISAPLAYSCRFWPDHVLLSAVEVELLNEVCDFFRDRLLFWLEALSLMGHIDGTATRIMSLSEWTSDRELHIFATDASKFITVFGPVLAQSSPHIYLSAVPLSPKRSTVTQHYQKLYPRTLSTSIGGVDGWPSLQLTIEGHRGVVASVAFSPGGERVASGSWDGTIRVWNAETGEVVCGPLSGHENWVTSVAFSHDGRRIVSGSKDRTIRVWDLRTGQMTSASFHGHNRCITSVAFSPDGSRVVSGSKDKTIIVWNSSTGDIISGPFIGHKKAVTSVTISPDGRRIASGSFDRTVRVWHMETGQVISTPFKGHKDTVTSVAFSPDGKMVVSGSVDETVRLWDAETGQMVSDPFLGHTHEVTSVAFSPDGRRIVSGSCDNTSRVWNAETGEPAASPFEGHSHWVTSVDFSRDGKRVVSGSHDMTIRLWDAESGEVVSGSHNGHQHAVTCIAVSRDGKRIISGSDDKTLRVWDAHTGELICGPIEAHTDAITSVAISPDGRRVASGSWDTTIRVWSSETGEDLCGQLYGHIEAVASVAFSPDGRHIASGSYDKTVRIWDSWTGKVVSRPFIGHSNWVTSVAYSPDGRIIVSGSWDETVRLWDVRSGQTISEPFESHEDPVTSVAFSPDGKLVISGSQDEKIWVWDAMTGVIISGMFERHTDTIASIAVSPDGTLVASGSWDHTIWVWDMESGEAVFGPWKGHSSRVLSVAFSPDGKEIVSGSDDSSIRVWDIGASLDEAEMLASGPKEESGISPPSLSEHSTRTIDDSQWTLDRGWVRNSKSELLFWVPPWARAGLWFPRNSLVLSKHLTKLDLARFVHGTSWTKCRG
ncbi:WD40 repeat-like protein [Leucogyrophana mollusca]|uniref:WD40 repeat-like protein n=1 Tax=Leucogyrophana mollusca TaxID=85980 RepID=A0ACB8BAU7_9AGAM|nr:WD40 repeat-like protein [Leucogyrophana mollusca]